MEDILKDEMIQLIKRRAAVRTAEATRMYDALFSPTGVLVDALLEGRAVQLRGFGKFYVTERKASGGNYGPIPKTPIVRFKPSVVLKRCLKDHLTEGPVEEEDSEDNPLYE